MGKNPKSKRSRINHLVKVLSIQTKSSKQELMVAFIAEEVKRLNDGTVHAYTKDGNVYITKGQAKSYPCVVAHMDTVHQICDTFKIYEHRDALFSVDTSDYTRTGIGGDDKVGIFCCLEALEKLKNVKIAFFRDEEIGCVGSNLADMKFFEDVSFVLQADRKGYSDFVRKIGGIELYNDAFATAIEPILNKYNKTECLMGGSTDVAALFKKGVSVCVANCSCGYYNPHQNGEYVIISEVFSTSDLFIDIINKLHVEGEKWSMPKYTTPVYTTNSRVKNYLHDGWEDDNPYDYMYGRQNTYKPKFYWKEGFHFGKSEGKMDTIIHDISCPTCNDKVDKMYDDLEDGYYCVRCNEYCYLPQSKWGVNQDTPDDNVISKYINSRLQRKRNKRKSNRRKNK